MDRDLKIVVNGDRSITVSETSLEGKRLTYVVSAADAHDWLVERGAVCGSKHKHKHSEPITTDLTPALDVSADKIERRLILEEINVLLASRRLLMDDVLAQNRNERLEEIEETLKMYRERLDFLDILIGSATAIPQDGIRDI